MRHQWVRFAAAFAFLTLSVRAQVGAFLPGPEFVGTGATPGQGFSASEQGFAVAISADGNTAIVGAPFDSQALGATWIWVRGSDGTWTQQGSKMVASDAAGSIQEGSSVALSADGNTAIVGAVGNSQQNGAAWIWTRSNGVWTQQGSALPAVGGPVAISADGNTAIIAGPPGYYGSKANVAVWTRSNGLWTQQGPTLNGSDPGTETESASMVAISGDGQTLAFGAPDDNVTGAVWVFTVSNGVWTQQGPKIVPSGALNVDNVGFGQAVALSSDGNTMLVGQPGDGDTAVGRAWIYTRTNGTWSETAELVGTDPVGAAEEGYSVALSADGNTAILGGREDDAFEGAVWAFQQSNGVWTQTGGKLNLSAANDAALGWSVGVSGDGKTVIAGGPHENDYAGSAWLYYASQFSLVPGELAQVSVGADGTLVGVNNAGEVYLYNAQQSEWMSLPGALKQISVGSADAIWGINAQGLIYQWSAAGQKWNLIPGTLAQIAVGADGDVWGINAQQSVFHFNAQAQKWQEVTGALQQIAVGFDGAVWGVNSASRVYRFNPGSGVFEQALGTMHQVMVGADGDVWGLNGHTAYHFNRLTQNWDQTAGTFTTISVGAGSNVWALDTSQQVYKYNGEAAAWVAIPSTPLAQVSAGANGAVWGVDSSGNIYRFTGPVQSSAMVVPVAGTLTQIAVGTDGSAWGVNASGQIYTYNPLTQGWTYLAGELSQIQVGTGESVWGLNSDNQTYHYDPLTQGWDWVPGTLTQISVGANGDVWGLNSSEQIYRYDKTKQSWAWVPGSLRQISVGADGTVWGINYLNQIYYYNSAAQTWVSVAGTLTQISAGSADNVWGINPEGGAYRYDAQSRSWNYAGGIFLSQIAVAFDGAVFGIDSAGQLVEYVADIGTWTPVPVSLSQLSVASDAAAWGLDASGSIYRF